MENSIYLENQDLRINELRLKRRIEELEAKVKEQELAINYSQCYKSDSELRYDGVTHKGNCKNH